MGQNINWNQLKRSKDTSPVFRSGNKKNKTHCYVESCWVMFSMDGWMDEWMEAQWMIIGKLTARNSKSTVLLLLYTHRNIYI